MAGASKEAGAMALEKILYIHYLYCFQKNIADVRVLINSDSLVSIIAPEFVLKLDFRAQKINSSTLQIFEMVLASFQGKNKLERVQFFYKTFLLANTGVKMVLEILFLTFSNAKILFAEQKLS